MSCRNQAGTGTAALAVAVGVGVALDSFRADSGIAVIGKSIGGDVNSIAFVLCVTKLKKIRARHTARSERGGTAYLNDETCPVCET